MTTGDSSGVSILHSRIEPPSVPRVVPDSGVWALAAGCVLFATIVFNPLLALVNANAMTVGRMHVVLAEVAIVSAAMGLILWRRVTPMLPWAGLLWLLIAVFLALSFIRGDLDPKLIRDVLLIPVFAMLGMVFAGASLVRLFAVMQVTVLAVMIFEALAPTAFGDMLDIAQYYIDTRGFEAEDFWNEESKLFASATRPGERFLPIGFELHRLSSLFLEPVSLGNWAVVMTIATVTLWRRMGASARAFFLISIALILVGCDGRLATVTCAVILAGAWLFERTPARIALLYLPAAVLCAMGLAYLLGLQPGPDDFGGRLAHTVDLLKQFTVGALFGIDHDLLDGAAADSGLAYFLLTQSLVGVVAIWLAICLLMPDRPQGRILTHGTALYVAMVLLVSYSLFSIKTAAALWFLFGNVQLAALAGHIPAFSSRTGSGS